MVRTLIKTLVAGASIFLSGLGSLESSANDYTTNQEPSVQREIEMDCGKNELDYQEKGTPRINGEAYCSGFGFNLEDNIRFHTSTTELKLGCGLTDNLSLYGTIGDQSCVLTRGNLEGANSENHRTESRRSENIVLGIGLENRFVVDQNPNEPGQFVSLDVDAGLRFNRGSNDFKTWTPRPFFDDPTYIGSLDVLLAEHCGNYKFGVGPSFTTYLTKGSETTRVCGKAELHLPLSKHSYLGLDLKLGGSASGGSIGFGFEK